MPTQVIPITDLAKAGVVIDTPSVSLPPNVFSEVSNVRFRDGAIRKMEGEREIQFNIGPSDLIFVAYWPEASLAPDDGYFVVVGRRAATATDRSLADIPNDATEVDEIFLFRATAPMTTVRRSGVFAVLEDTFWQHTLFGGGSTFVINNRTDKPMYALGSIDESLGETIQLFFDLPGWDSYLVDEQITSFFYDTAFITPEGTDLGTFVNLSVTAPAVLPAGLISTADQDILVAVIPADTRIVPFNIRIDDYNDTNGGTPVVAASVGYNAETGTTFITFAPRVVAADGTVTTQGVLPGDSVTIRIQTEPQIQVRAGVIRAHGDLLVAGNLTEMDRDDVSRVVRNLPGVIRTSDVAAPGSVPANWNPFKTGVNTAEEITLSSTGIIQDMVELQGILYVYTNESIHSMQLTGNPTVPFNVRPVSRGWGAQTIDAVQEFDGRHIVIGTGDIFTFSGHPGSIQSIADARVRDFFFNDLDRMYEQNLFTLLYRRRDEIWINYPSMRRLEADRDGQCDRTLIWNYRDNTWTIREQSPFWNGVISPIQPTATVIVNPNKFYPLLTSTKATAAGIADPDSVFVADADGKFTDVAAAGYESYVERQRLAITPEFNTENLASVAMLTEGLGSILEVRATGTDAPSASTDLSTTGEVTNEFNVTSDYKVDLRVHGRLLNYRITDEGRTTGWDIAGLQFDIGRGGTR